MPRPMPLRRGSLSGAPAAASSASTTAWRERGGAEAAEALGVVHPGEPGVEAGLEEVGRGPWSRAGARRATPRCGAAQFGCVGHAAGSVPVTGTTTTRPVVTPSATPLHGVRGPVERHALADQRLDGAPGGQLGQLLVAVLDQLRVLGVVQAPVQAEDRVVLHQGVVEAGAGDGAAGEADDHDPALEGDDLGGLGVGLAADGVVDHVRAAAAGGLLHGGDDVLAPPVDHDVAAQLPGDGRLLGTADDADDGGAGRLRRAARPRCRPLLRRRGRAASRPASRRARRCSPNQPVW